MRRSVFTCSERRAGGSCGTGRAPRRKEALRKKRVQEPACVPPRRPAPCEPSALTLEVRAERSGVVHALLRGRKSRSSPVRCQLHKTTLASPRVRTTGEPHGIKSTSAAVCTPRSCTVFVIAQRGRAKTIEGSRAVACAESTLSSASSVKQCRVSPWRGEHVKYHCGEAQAVQCPVWFIPRDARVGIAPHQTPSAVHLRVCSRSRRNIAILHTLRDVFLRHS